MSDKILYFAAAGAVADREFRFVTHPMKWTLAREAALEAQAQARLAVERVIRQRAEDRWEAAATEAAEMRQRAEAAEAALKAERERADKLADTISRTHSAQLIPPDGSHTQCTVCGAGDDEQSRIPWWI